MSLTMRASILFVGMGLTTLVRVCPIAAGDPADHPENVWVLQSPRADAPAPRYLYEGSGAWDPWQRQFIRWGGHDGIPQGFHLFVWDLESGRWQQRFPNTSPPGACCIDGANVFDAANRRFVRFPGASLGHGYQWFRMVHLKNSHAWLYDPASNRWTNMRPPSYKEPAKYSREVLGSLNAGGTYDENRQVALSFGGQGAAGGMNNLFVYDAYANHLQRLDAADPPSPRDGMGICYDAKNDCLVVFGSQYGDDEKTWIYRYGTNRWESFDISPRPPGKKRKTYATIPKMAFDSVNGVCLCLVWFGDEGGRLETWVLDVAGKQWTKMDPTTEPGPTGSRARNLAYDRTLNLFLLECVDPKGNARIWTYRYRKAARQELPLPPPDDLVVTTGNGRARLTWTGEPSASVTQTAIYRARAENPWEAEFTKIGTTEGNTYEDPELATGQVYFYRVRTVGPNGQESRPSFHVRTQPRVPDTPVVSVLAADRVQVRWPKSAQPDVVGYNVYRGLVTVGTNTSLKGSWGHNDPEYPVPVVDRVRDVTAIEKLNREPSTEPQFVDDRIDLAQPPAESADYPFAVYAYVVRAVNALGTESGPSPYALTIPAEPQSVLLREEGKTAVLKWDASREQGVEGYRVYRIDGRAVTRLTPDPIPQTTFTIPDAPHSRFAVAAVDALGQEGQPSSPAWSGQSHRGFFEGSWHQ